MIRFRDVTKTFGSKAAVRDVSFDVRPGSITGLIGPNGSGKTTSLRLVLGLLRPERGAVELFGSAPSSRSTDRVGYLPEERGLYRRMTVREVLRFYCRLKSVEASRGAIDAWLDRLEVRKYAAEKVEALSKGTAQKVQFIATVLHEPQLLILDEPFSGLDPVSADVLRAAIGEVVARGTTVILSTHDMHTAEQLCDAVLMLHEGHKVLDGTRDEISRRFGDPTVKLRIDGVESTHDLSHLPGVTRVLDFRGYHELVLAAGVDTQALLTHLAALGRVQRFEVSTPSLHDIFVRLAKRTS